MRKLDRILCVVAACVFFLGAMLLLTYVWLEVQFANITLDIIIIHLFLHLGGADPYYYMSAVLWVSLVVLVCLLLFIFVWKSYRREKVAGMNASTFRRLFVAFSLALLFASIFMLNHRYQVIPFLFPKDPYSTYMDENYAMPRRSDFALQDGGNNLVVLILESTETVVNDEAYFNPVLMPRLNELQKKNGLVFTNRLQCIGSESSVSSYYALSMGMPSRAVLSARDMVELFLGLTTNKELGTEVIPEGVDYRDLSLFGFLEKYGYRASLFCSADASFCNFDMFMDNCTDDCDIRDYKYFLEHSPEITGRQSGWGLYDGFLLERAKEYIQNIHEKSPFVMMLKTVCTHSPGNYEPGLPRPYGDFRDTYVQTDMMIADFIEWIQSQPFGEKTTIAIVGDTRLSSNEIGGVRLPPLSERRVMATILNSRKKLPEGGERRLFTTFDLTPTVMEAIGGELPEGRFGMGVSLFSSHPTLLERDGVGKYSVKLTSRSRYIESIYSWGKPVQYKH